MRTSFEQLPEEKSHMIIKAGVKEFSTHTYSDAKTDRITSNCGISKGLLFHYFGTKKEFYLYCLQYSLDVLVKMDKPIPVGDFYGILFGEMEYKMHLCTQHADETKLLNMASRDLSREIKSEKDDLLGKYAMQMHTRSEQVLSMAIATLDIKSADKKTVAQGLTIYMNALINHYLLVYQETPEEFFTKKDLIKNELKSYIDLMLYGICL